MGCRAKKKPAFAIKATNGLWDETSCGSELCLTDLHTLMAVEAVIGGSGVV